VARGTLDGLHRTPLLLVALGIPECHSAWRAQKSQAERVLRQRNEPALAPYELRDLASRSSPR
jgi:hypothetical protein